MQIKVSDNIGFCFGVKHAVELSEEALSKKNGKIYSMGPIIHNPQVVKELSDKGLTPVEDIDGIKEGTVVVSSHGAGAKLKKKKGIKLIDATCPFVKKIQNRVDRLYKDGYSVIIIGKKAHPEVKALTDFTDGRAIVVKDAGEARELELNGSKVGIVSQSTYSQDTFLEIVSILLNMPFSEIRVFNTICRDTIKRQGSVRILARDVDMMIVVGGKNSSNTRRLVEVCKDENRDVYHIENEEEIDRSWFSGKESVGIASGTSTPGWVVQDIIDQIGRYN